jgi:hypothetical protein
MNGILKTLGIYYTKKRLTAIFIAGFIVGFCLIPFFGGETSILYWLLFAFFTPLLENEIYKRL